MILGSWTSSLAATQRIGLNLSIGDVFRSPKAQAFQTKLEAFLHWWGAELWACLPEAWRHRLRHRAPHFTVALQDDPGRVLVVEGSDTLPGCAFAFTPQSAQESATLKAIQRAIRNDGGRLEVLIREQHVVLRRLTLPLAAQDSLRDAVGLELDRSSRFQVHEVYFDCSVVGTDRDAKTITVDVAIVLRAHVNEIVTMLRAAGLSPSAVSARRNGGERSGVTFLRASTKPKTTIARVLTIALMLLVLALDVAAAYVPLWVKIDVLSDLQARIESTKAEVEEAQGLERVLGELRGRNAYIVNLKKQTPSMTGILAELARVLPDTAWLERLQVREGRIRIAGFATDSTDLIAALEQSPILSDVRLEWPIMAGSATNADHFDVSARIENAAGHLP